MVFENSALSLSNPLLYLVRCRPSQLNTDMIMLLHQTNFSVVILVGLVVADRKSSKYVAMKSPDGEELCAIVVPTAVEWFAPHGSDVQCGLECVKRVHCKAFNFNSQLGKCDHYETMPSNFSVISDCKGYAIECE